MTQKVCADGNKHCPGINEGYMPKRGIWCRSAKSA